MRVSELADRAGVTVRMIRHYENAGLLHAVRLPNGYRDFAPAAVDRTGRPCRLPERIAEVFA